MGDHHMPAVLVVRTYEEMSAIRKAIQCDIGKASRRGNAGLHVTYPGDALTGHRYSHILIAGSLHAELTADEGPDYGTPLQHEMWKRWWNEAMLTRMGPGGHILFLD